MRFAFELVHSAKGSPLPKGLKRKKRWRKEEFALFSCLTPLVGTYHLPLSWAFLVLRPSDLDWIAPLASGLQTESRIFSLRNLASQFLIINLYVLMSPSGSVSVLCLWRTLTNRDSPHLGKTAMPDRVRTQCPKGRESPQAGCLSQPASSLSPFSVQPSFLPLGDSGCCQLLTRGHYLTPQSSSDTEEPFLVAEVRH